MKNKLSFKEFKKKALHGYGDLTAVLFIDFFTVRISYLIYKYNLKIKPNDITLVRIFILAPVIVLLLFLAPYYNLKSFYLIVAILMYFIMFTDNLDGQLARGTGQTSKSGAFLDTISDRVSNIILFVTIFSFALWLDNYILLCGSIFLFTLKTVNLMIISKIYYYGGANKKDNYALFGGTALDSMGFKKVWNLGKGINKILGIKRWAGNPSSFEQYLVTIILPCILIFFNQTTFVVYLTYFIIIFFGLFYIKRISSLLSKYI